MRKQKEKISLGDVFVADENIVPGLPKGTRFELVHYNSEDQTVIVQFDRNTVIRTDKGLVEGTRPQAVTISLEDLAKASKA